MPEPTLISPNTGNYRIGKGKVSFKKDGAVDWTDLGNCTEATITPTNEKLDHFTSREGIRQKDLSVLLEQGGTLAITMEEFTPYNVALMVMGTLDEDAVGGPEVEIFAETEIIGQLKIEATNDVGPRIDWLLYRVSLNPNGEFGAFEEDEWGNMELEGEMLVSETVGDTLGKFGILKWTNLADAS
ncbi:MAG: hypothetical protein EHM78_02115 [Myxococcaceae bacterium]|nr:MAG: hypothetical protein EHM78_02115 [Myxococcaceae bacterium]